MDNIIMVAVTKWSTIAENATVQLLQKTQQLNYPEYPDNSNLKGFCGAWN